MPAEGDPSQSRDENRRSRAASSLVGSLTQAWGKIVAYSSLISDLSHWHEDIKLSLLDETSISIFTPFRDAFPKSVGKKTARARGGKSPTQIELQRSIPLGDSCE